MKLAEALQERADINHKINQLNERLSNNCLVQEGEEPAENPEELLKELDRCIDRLQWLIARINKTNCETVIDGKTLTDWIAEKDCLSVKISAYRNLVFEASQTAHRATKTEIVIKSTLNIKELQKTSDKIAKELRLVDNKLQQCNWTTDLIE